MTARNPILESEDYQKIVKECQQLNETFGTCNEQNRFGRYFGTCSSMETSLVRCLKKEFKFRSEFNNKKAEEHHTWLAAKRPSQPS